MQTVLSNLSIDSIIAWGALIMLAPLTFFYARFFYRERWLEKHEYIYNGLWWESPPHGAFTILPIDVMFVSKKKFRTLAGHNHFKRKKERKE